MSIVPTIQPPRFAMRVPGSKSITNRALVLAALASRESACTLTGVLRSEDTEVMVDCLTKLGYRFRVDWDAETIGFEIHGSPRWVPEESADLFVANSGTTVRFLAAMVTLSPGVYRLDGVPRMRERPIQDLLDALSQLGIEARSDAGTGCPPVTIRSRGWPDREIHVRVRAGVSSQFLSGLMLAAPWHGRRATFEVDGPVVSEPYLDMSAAMISHWGGRVEGFTIDGRSGMPPKDYSIEPDASSASYFFAMAAILGGQGTVLGTRRSMLQGDIRFVDCLERMGCRVEECEEGITVYGRPLTGIDIDMNAISDTVMTLAAVACYATGTTTIRNVAHIRHKETDRIAAVANELRRVGLNIDERPDGLIIHPGPMHAATLETYRDHRMAMSLALLGLKTPGIIIDDPGCVAKTYPTFWIDFERQKGSG